VVLVPVVAVGANGVPVNVGDANVAFNANKAVISLARVNIKDKIAVSVCRLLNYYH
jgi:hypothetical protein